MKIKQMLFSILVLILLAACADDDAGDKVDAEADGEAENENLTESGLPIVNEPITLKFLAGKHPTNKEDYNEVAIWKEYSEMSNINIDWDLIPFEGLEEKRNLALVGGKLPDVFYTTKMPNNDLFKYGEQGIFIELTDLIEEHMPNLSKLLDENPEIRKGMTSPDGSIYGLPSLYDPDFTSVHVGGKFWIREDWLDQLGMDAPETTDELYEYLKAVKETDLMGDGENKEIPFGAYRLNMTKDFLKGSFGVQNKGAMNGNIDLDPDTDELRFYPITDGYKEMLQYLNKLFSEELILESIYTIDKQQETALGADGLFGSTIGTGTAAFGDELEEKYIGLPPFKGPHGDQVVSNVRSSLESLGPMVITKDNEHVEATLRWQDYFYGEEGRKMFFMGIEGESYEETEDGEFEFMDHITNNPDGLTVPEARAPYVTYAGGHYPGIVDQKYFKGAESYDASIEVADKIEPLIGDEVWPSFTYTSDENKVLSSTGSDIEKYIGEMEDKFITGSKSFDEWDEYVEEIKSMGLDEYMEVKEAAYERYKNN